jgi:hypothetical protein
VICKLSLIQMLRFASGKFLLFVFNKLQGDHTLSFFFYIFHNSMCQVLFGSCKKMTRSSLKWCYIFLVLRDHWFQYLNCFILGSDQAGASGSEECCTFPISFIYRPCHFNIIVLWFILIINKRDHTLSRFLINCHPW